MKTLEDLKEYLENKYRTEWISFDYLEVFRKSQAITENYYLSKSELDYVMPIKQMNEEQSNSQTLLNSEKAKKILLKLKEQKS